MNSYLEISQELSTGLKELHARYGRIYATAESLTGGGIAAAIVSVPGSSAWFDRGFITYSNEAKVQMLGVSEETLRHEGAVSEPVARQMALGALERSSADIAVAVTGIAGPAGGSAAKPVGTVWIAAAGAGRCRARLFHFQGTRAEIREQTVIEALRALAEMTAAG